MSIVAEVRASVHAIPSLDLTSFATDRQGHGDVLPVLSDDVFVPSPADWADYCEATRPEPTTPWDAGRGLALAGLAIPGVAVPPAHLTAQERREWSWGVRDGFREYVDAEESSLATAEELDARSFDDFEDDAMLLELGRSVRTLDRRIYA